MSPLNRSQSYFIIFWLSFQILALQIALSLLLRIFTSLPFLAVSFAFLGLSASGVFFYLWYHNKPIQNPLMFIARNLVTYGALLISYVIMIAIYSEFRIDIVRSFAKKLSLPFDVLIQHYLTEVLIIAFVVGFLFSITLFCLGLAIAMIYKSNSDSAPKLYLFDLLGASAGCIIGVLILNYLYPSAILISLSLLSFTLAFTILLREGSSLSFYAAF